METQVCRTCKKSKELVEELWHRNKSTRNGWSITCKPCVRIYQHKRRHRTLAEIESLNTHEPETFGDFEAQAAGDMAKRATEGVISIYQDA